jgi:hypothetical protein
VFQSNAVSAAFSLSRYIIDTKHFLNVNYDIILGIVYSYINLLEFKITRRLGS